MTIYDEQLRQLQAKIARYRQLTARVAELRRQREDLRHNLQPLETKMRAQQADVDRLQAMTPAAIFYGLLGKKEEKLDQERREALAAKAKYDAARQALDAVIRELSQDESELAALSGCEDAYARLLAEKAAALKSAGGPEAQRILSLEERLAFLGSQKQEVREALRAGSAALDTTRQILSDLDDAESWGTWDLIGGGLISDLAKHSHLDEAQGRIGQLQTQLSRFKTELADIAVQSDMQVTVEGFLRFADYFFDGLFADFAVLDRIHQSQEQVRQTASQIRAVQSRLERMEQDMDRERDRVREQLDTLVRQAQM